jgi:hypothetical protein
VLTRPGACFGSRRMEVFGMRQGIALLGAAALSCAVPGAALAASCSMLSSNLDDARSNLERAARAETLEDATARARRARNDLDDASASARDCGCPEAADELDTASSRARRARDASDGPEFTDALNGAIRSYNSALRSLRTCKPSSR